MKLVEDARWRERALLAIYDRQLAYEKKVEQTVYHNDIGFQPADARAFSDIAVKMKQRNLAEGERLTDRETAYIMRPWGKKRIPTLAKYRGQILELIERKAKGD